MVKDGSGTVELVVRGHLQYYKWRARNLIQSDFISFLALNPLYACLFVHLCKDKIVPSWRFRGTQSEFSILLPVDLFLAFENLLSWILWLIFLNSEKMIYVIIIEWNETNGRRYKEKNGWHSDIQILLPFICLFQMVTKTKKIFVGGLSAQTTVEDVKMYFSSFGKVSTH